MEIPTREDYHLKNEHQENLPLANDTTDEKRWQKFYLGLAAGLVLVFLIVIGLFSYHALYHLANDKLTLTAARLISLPAGFVEGKRLLYTDFQEERQGVTRFYNSQKNKDPQAQIPDDKEISDSVWQRMSRNVVLEKMAQAAKISVNNEEINQEFENFVKETGSEEKTTALLRDTYGWTAYQFKKRVMYPYLLQKKLTESKQTEEALFAAAKTKIEAVLTEVKEGKSSFEDLAKKYGQDGSAAQGGDLGWFGQGVMIPDFEKAAFALEKGVVSELVKTQFGYHIIKVEDKEVKKGETRRARARHILIRAQDINTYLDEALKKAKIWQWIKI